MNIIILRGWARESRHWHHFPQILQKQSKHKVFCFDLPGTGDQNKFSSPLSCWNIAREIRSRWEIVRHQSSQPWVILGISFGGMIAMEWFYEYSEDFQALICINTSDSRYSSRFQRIRIKALQKIGKIACAKNRKERERLILGLTSNLKQKERDQLLEKWVEIAESKPITLGTEIRQLIAAARFKAPNLVDEKMLFISSKKDNLVDPNCSRNLAETFNAPHIQHPWSGHDLSLDDPEWLSQQIKEFMSTI